MGTIWKIFVLILSLIIIFSGLKIVRDYLDFLWDNPEIALSMSNAAISREIIAGSGIAAIGLLVFLVYLSELVIRKVD